MPYGGTAKQEIYTQVNLNADLFSRFHHALARLQDETNLSRDEILGLLEREHEFVPVSVFAERRLGVLEITVKFLKEERGFTLGKIAGALKRDHRTIWSSYHHACSKCPERLAAEESIAVPLKAFQNRRLGALESLVVYLRDEYRMRYSDIAMLLARDQRTIWTVYSRARNK